mmetsp:Transcript_32423/g.72807  ORF Transcript_32423/g.72807 Transcript_32423/m.72807 type:complete len:581 (+) Transcript_32423:401-2143(+)
MNLRSLFTQNRPINKQQRKNNDSPRNQPPQGPSYHIGKRKVKNVVRPAGREPGRRRRPAGRGTPRGRRRGEPVGHERGARRVPAAAAAGERRRAAVLRPAGHAAAAVHPAAAAAAGCRRGVPPAAAAGQRRAGRPVHVPHTLHPLRPPQLRPQGDRVLLPPPRPVRARPAPGLSEPAVLQLVPRRVRRAGVGHDAEHAPRAAGDGLRGDGRGEEGGRAGGEGGVEEGTGEEEGQNERRAGRGRRGGGRRERRGCHDPDAGAQDGAVDERGDRVLRQAHQQVHDRSAPPARGGQVERVPVADAQEQAVEAHQEDEECQAEHQDVQADHGLPRRRHGGPGLLRVGGLLPPVHFQPARAVRAQVSHPEAVEGDLLDLLRQPRAAAERRRVARVGRGDGPAGAPGEGPREAGQEEDHDGPGDTAGHAQPGQRRGHHSAPGEQRQPEQRKLGGEPPEPADRGERLPRRDGVRRGRVGRPGGVVQPLPPPDHGVHAQEQRPVRVRRRLGPELRRHGGERVGQPRREPGGGRAGLEVQAVLRGLHGREAGGDEPGSGRPRAEAGPADEQGRAVHAGRVRGLLRVVQF